MTATRAARHARRLHAGRLAVAVIGALALTSLVGASRATAEESWTIERFHSDITIQADGKLFVVETIDVDFGAVGRHGIYRDIPVRFRRPDDTERVYGLTIDFVTDGGGKRLPVERSERGPYERLRIGDGGRTVTGRQSYRIAYRVQDAIDGSPDVDSLFWNVNGATWPVASRTVSAKVLLTARGVQSAACFQGVPDSVEPCSLQEDGDRVEYRASRSLAPGERLAVSVGVRKGLLPEPKVAIQGKTRDFGEYFELSPVSAVSTLLVLVGGFALVARTSLRGGRDLWYSRMHYRDALPLRWAARLFGRDEVAPEPEPPEEMRPAQIGLLLDERLDARDLTATLVDLASRRYIAIAEVPGGDGRDVDWLIAKNRRDNVGLQPYEEAILAGLFREADELRLSRLPEKFVEALWMAEDALLEDVVKQGLFRAKPVLVRLVWLGIGLAALIGGFLLMHLLGRMAGAGLVGVAGLLLGVALIVGNPLLPRRSALGSELFRRALGFRQALDAVDPVSTGAEVFTQYLPYAIVYGSAQKWARAFRSIDTSAAIATWYATASPVSSAGLSLSLQSFAAHLITSVAALRRPTGGPVLPTIIRLLGRGSWRGGSTRW
jgi:hypothetical protein